MIGLGPAGQRGQQVVLDAADVEFDHLPAAARRHQRHQLVVGQADFLPGVEVEVVGRGLDPGLRPADRAVQQVVGGDQMLVDGVAQVRQIDAAERAVPIAAIALAAIQLGAGLLDQFGVDRVAGGGRGDGLLQPAADDHHAAVHLVGFGILHLEVPPEPAAHERPQRRPTRIVLHLVRRSARTRRAARPAAPIRSSRGSCNRADRSCPPAARCRTPRPAWSLGSNPGSAPRRRRTAPASRRRRRVSSFPARCRTSRRRRRRRQSRRDAPRPSWPGSRSSAAAQPNGIR